MEYKMCSKSELEYYYYFKISTIKKLKDEYNQINSELLGKDFNSSFVSKCDSIPEGCKITSYDSYKKLYDDFNLICNQIINGECISNTDDFVNSINILMLIINETIEYTHYNFYFKAKRKFYKQKVSYDKKLCIKDLVIKNTNLPYMLNPDEFTSIAVDRFSRFLINIITLFFILLGFVIIVSVKNSIGCNIENIFSNIIALCGVSFSSLFIFLRVRVEKALKHQDVKNKIYIRNYHLITHPFKSDFKIVESIFKRIAKIIRKGF